MSVPVDISVLYEPHRNRLRTLVRLLLALPLLIVNYLWTACLLVVSVVAWFVLLVTGRWPDRMWDIATGCLRYITRTNAYVFLLTDQYPSFGIEDDTKYPVRLVVTKQDSHNRLLVLLRVLYAIPALVAAYVLNLVMEITGLVSWVVILVAGQQPEILQKILVFCLSFYVRTIALLCSITDTYPQLP